MNREKFKYGLFRVTNFLPFRWMRDMPDQQFVFPFYHVVSDQPRAGVRHLYPVPSVSRFKSDLDFLMSQYYPASVEEVTEYATTGRKPVRPLFFPSFDDGFSECASIIAPVLKEKGIQAAFFVNPSSIGNQFLAHRQKVSLLIDRVLRFEDQDHLRELFRQPGFENLSIAGLVASLKNLSYRDQDKIESFAFLLGIDFSKALEEKPYMDLNQVAELRNAGHVIGSHSMDHPEFYRISEAERIRQIEESFAFIRTEVGEEHRFFAFPFTDDGTPASFFNYLREEASVISFGTAGLKKYRPGHIQRIPMETELLKGAEPVLRAEYVYYFLKAMVGKNKIRSK